MEIVLFIALICLIGYSFTSKSHNAGKGESSGGSSTSSSSSSSSSKPTSSTPPSSEPKE